MVRFFEKNYRGAALTYSRVVIRSLQPDVPRRGRQNVRIRSKKTQGRQIAVLVLFELHRGRRQVRRHNTGKLFVLLPYVCVSLGDINGTIPDFRTLSF